MKIKRMEKLRSRLQMAMKENGTLHPDQRISICHDPIGGGYELAIEAERLTNSYSYPILEILMEGMINVLTREIHPIEGN